MKREEEIKLDELRKKISMLLDEQWDLEELIEEKELLKEQLGDNQKIKEMSEEIESLKVRVLEVAKEAKHIGGGLL